MADLKARAVVANRLLYPLTFIFDIARTADLEVKPRFCRFAFVIIYPFRLFGLSCKRSVGTAGSVAPGNDAGHRPVGPAYTNLQRRLKPIPPIFRGVDPGFAGTDVAG